LGLGNTTNYSSPKQVGALTNWSTFSSGYYHTNAVKTNGTAWAWGKNSNGQLGLSNTTDISSPVQIGALTNWLGVAAGAYHSLAIKTDGTLWAMGNNGINGRLGLSDLTYRSSPTQVGARTTWTSISAGNFNGMAIGS